MGYFALDPKGEMEVREAGAVPLLINLLSTDSISINRECVIYALANIACAPESRALMRNWGAIPRLVNSLSMVGFTDYERKRSAHALTNLAGFLVHGRSEARPFGFPGEGHKENLLALILGSPDLRDQYQSLSVKIALLKKILSWNPTKELSDPLSTFFWTPRKTGLFSGPCRLKYGILKTVSKELAKLEEQFAEIAKKTAGAAKASGASSLLPLFSFHSARSAEGAGVGAGAAGSAQDWQNSAAVSEFDEAGL